MRCHPVLSNLSSGRASYLTSNTAVSKAERMRDRNLNSAHTEPSIVGRHGKLLCVATLSSDGNRSRERRYQSYNVYISLGKRSTRGNWLYCGTAREEISCRIAGVLSPPRSGRSDSIREPDTTPQFPSATPNAAIYIRSNPNFCHFSALARQRTPQKSSTEWQIEIP